MNNINRFRNWSWLFSLPILGVSCEFVLPEAGSLPDNTPPAAAFSTTPDIDNSKMIHFTNTSVSASKFAWDFGDGNISIDDNPANLYPGEGTYTVTLTATDDLGVSSTIIQDVEVVEPKFYQPVILASGFEEDPDDASFDPRDPWRAPEGQQDNRPAGLGGPFQITSDPVWAGAAGGKLPDDNTRCGYQQITVEPDSDYRLSFYYTMKESPAGTLTVAILNGGVVDPADVAGGTIESVTVNDQSAASAYVKATVEFNSGSNTAIVIYVTNQDVECRVDDFDIEVL